MGQQIDVCAVWKGVLEGGLREDNIWHETRYMFIVGSIQRLLPVQWMRDMFRSCASRFGRWERAEFDQHRSLNSCSGSLGPLNFIFAYKVFLSGTFCQPKVHQFIQFQFQSTLLRLDYLHTCRGSMGESLYAGGSQV